MEKRRVTLGGNEGSGVGKNGKYCSKVKFTESLDDYCARVVLSIDL